MTPLSITVVFSLLLVTAASALYAALYGDYSALKERFGGLAVRLRLRRGEIGEADIGLAGFPDRLVRLAMRSRPAAGAVRERGDKLGRILVRAGFAGSKAAQVYQAVRFLSIGAGTLAGILAGILIQAGPFDGILCTAGGGIIGAIVPQYYLTRRARLRQAAITRQLSDVLDLLVVCVEAGLGLHESINLVGTETGRYGQEIGSELMLVSREFSTGTSLGQAIRSMAQRTGVDDMKPLAATMLQSEQLGAQIAPALRANSDALRAKRKLRAEEAAQKATIKILIPLVLFVLPAMLLVIVGPSMIHILRTIHP